MAIISSVFDHRPALHLVSLLPASLRAQNDFHRSGYKEVAYNPLSKKVLRMPCSLSCQGQVLSCAVIRLGSEGLRGDGSDSLVYFVLRAQAAGRPAYGTFKDLTIRI